MYKKNKINKSNLFLCEYKKWERDIPFHLQSTEIIIMYIRMFAELIWNIASKTKTQFVPKEKGKKHRTQNVAAQRNEMNATKIPTRCNHYLLVVQWRLHHLPRLSIRFSRFWYPTNSESSWIWAFSVLLTNFRWI